MRLSECLGSELAARPALPSPSKDEDPLARAAGPDLVSFLPMVRSIASRIYATIPPYASVELNDLMQSGNLGLLHAGRAYQSSRRVPFAVYARFRIRGEILDSLRSVDMASRTMRRLDKRRRAAADGAPEALPPETTPGGPAQPLPIPARLLTSIDALASGEAGPVAQNGWRAADPSPECLRAESEARGLLREAVENLPARAREMVDLYYRDGLTMREIGARFRVNESRVSQIHRSALLRMARYLRASGVRSAREI